MLNLILVVHSLYKYSEITDKGSQNDSGWESPLANLVKALEPANQRSNSSNFKKHFEAPPDA